MIRREIQIHPTGVAPTRTLTADSIHRRLRAATATRHRRLDRGLEYLLSERLTRERYGDLLAAMFGFYAPLEEHLSRWCSDAAAPALPPRRRTPLLDRDLRALGRAPAETPLCPALPTLTTGHHAAGAVYVLEGASLGGQVIARAVMPRLAVGLESGAAFFSGEGAEIGGRWRQVLSWLEALDRGAQDRAAMVAGARRTFDSLTRWLDGRGVLDE